MIKEKLFWPLDKDSGLAGCTHTTHKSLFDFGSRLCSARPRHYSLNAKEVPKRFLNRNCWVPVLLGGSKRYSWDGCVANWYVIQVGGDQVVGLLSVFIWSTRVLVCVIQKNVKKKLFKGKKANSGKIMHNAQGVGTKKGILPSAVC